ncbi:MAG: MOSC N-terminal beta barrel domain-containing protein [Polaromonas sp.]|nr:MOSC N-terminal beta barrel domain-containing protein [Polaromonas sp.]
MDKTAPAEVPDVSAVIQALWVYPVKSCAGISVNEAILTDTGLNYDRAWMVVDARGDFLTQRELPRMVLIQPKLKTDEMVLRAPGMLALHVALYAAESATRVRVWGEEVAAFSMGAVAAQWFSDFLGIEARLVRFDATQRRLSDPQWTGGVEAFNQFSDGFAALVLSQPSLDHFNRKLLASGTSDVTMARFRPNIVLGSAAGAIELLPYDEDRLETLDIATDTGAVQLRLVKPCLRCPVPNVDPATGLSSPAVGDMLQRFRADARLGGAVTFGMNAIVVGAEGNSDVEIPDLVLRVGQRVAGRYRFD